ncbi:MULTISPECIES: type I polyketide synthase, partial [Nocardia]|uniref:type I polyketide synthase n=1 Tax=Nocardia TaxID=1817 RepID=UPI00255C2A2B
MADDEKMLDYLKRVTVELRAARRKIDENVERAHEPIAVVGISCRYPGGVDSPDELWRLVRDGVDAVSDFPADRGWDLDTIHHPDPDHPGTTYARSGGFIAGATEFDAAFFGVAPREALAMDPQQRLLLEGTWAAFEDAGIDPMSVHGGEVGVFIGGSTSDYSHIARSSAVDLGGYWGIGTAAAVLSGRVAYAFGLTGPAVTIDTACSSSLVAVHLAAQSLRRGECELALAAGVAVNATPGVFVEFSRQRGLSPDGRCKSFAEGADGTGWSEGLGVLVLERLSEAQRRGHRVMGVVRGSAVNQDGASNGLTAPNGPSQERVIRAALADAGVKTTDVDAVEAHGTGTVLGDPIEAQALIATYGSGRSGDPLWLGSIKSNIGHSQAAAGMAGLIKMIMAIRHGELPRTLHVDTPTTKVDWAEAGVALLTEARPWRKADRPRRAAVSSFGVSGTNAHVIVEQAPEPAPVPVSDASSPFTAAPLAWVLSAKSAAALVNQARRLRERVLAEPGLDPVDVAWSLVTTRATLRFRAVIVGADREELLEGLDAVIEERSPAGTAQVITGQADRSGRVGFVFPGQGAQWAGMAVDLLDSSPVFAARIEECAKALEPHVDWSLAAVLRGEPGAPSLDRVDVVQPVLFSVMVSLAGLWESFGVRPDGVIGHSQGEIAAACVAGALSLEDAARIVAVRSRLIQHEVDRGGAMLSIVESEATVRSMLNGDAERIAITAVNGPRSVVVAGEPEVLATFERRLARAGIMRWMVPGVDFVAHSAAVTNLEDRLIRELATIRPRATETAFYSTVDGAAARTSTLDAGYWYRNLREPVRYAAGVRALLGSGHDVLIEVSAHPLLTLGTEETIADIGARAGVTATLQRGAGDPRRMLTALAEAFVVGARVDWPVLFAGRSARRVDLPTYAFDRERFWVTGDDGGDARALGMRPEEHPLLAGSVRLANGSGWLSTGRWSIDRYPWLADHTVFGEVVISGTTLVELAAAVGDRVGCPVVAELVLEAPLIVPVGGTVAVQLWVGEPDADGRAEFEVYSGADVLEGGWTRHASGTLTTGGSDAASDWDVRPPEDAVNIAVGEWYSAMAVRGVGYGPAFRGLRSVRRRGDEVFAEVDTAGDAGFRVHPAALDAVLHAVLVADDDAESVVALPFSWSGVRMYPEADPHSLRVRLTRTGPASVALVATDGRGRAALTVDSVSIRPVSVEQLRAARPQRADSLFTLDWTAAEPSSARPANSLALITESVALEEISSGTAERYRDLAALVADVAAGASPPAVVVAPIVAPADTDVPGAVHAVTRQTLELLQDWLSAPVTAHADTRLMIVTTRAMAVEKDVAPNLATAAIWGLVRSAQAEHPDQLVLADLELDPVDDPARWWREVELAAGAGAAQVAVRGGHIRVPRLRHAPATVPAAPVFDAESTVLITGGAGGLGAQVARHAVREHGVRSLVLASRGGASAAARALSAELTELGARVRLAACDVTDRAAVHELVASIGDEFPLRAVVHCAGVLADGVIASMSAAQLDRVLAAKVDGAWHLHEATRDLNLAGFVLFSSVAGVVGAPGQANYAAANVFLDALAQWRQVAGQAATALAWGFWEQDTAMTQQLGELDIARLADLGVAALSVDEGLALLDAALSRTTPALCPVRLDMGALRAQARLGALPEVLAGLVPPGDTRGESGARLRTRLAGLPAEEREDQLLRAVLDEVATVLHHRDARGIDPESAFRDLGFDSLAAVQFRNRLAATTGFTLSPTLVFDYPTPHALATYLLELIEPATPRQAPSRGGVGSAATDVDPIVVVGMACRYPGDVRSPEALWELVDRGVDAVTEFPDDRGWDVEALYHPDPDHPGTSYARTGGFLSDVGDFDAAFFGVGPREALAMDPQQRLLLEGTWEALEDAGIDPESLRGSDTGVFAGVMYQDYELLARTRPDLGGYWAVGSAGSVLSGRVAYTFGLTGPALTVDTACSSSLVAVHLAAQSLRRGECGMAVAAGVTVNSTPTVFVEFSRQRAMSVDGRCRSFAEGADGAGWSEGLGVLVLERLS